MGEEQEQKFHQLTEEPVSRVISHLAVPCIISMLVTAFYNMADTFFVGMLRSNAATGAVGVVFSMMAVIQAVGFFFGHGSGNFISRELGRRNTDSASNMAATGFFSALFTGLLICVFGEIFLTPLAAFLGSSPTILPYAKDYLRVVDDRLPGTEQPAALPGQRHLRHHRHRQRRRAEHRAGSPADLRL